jgi:hypothetical protein
MFIASWVVKLRILITFAYIKYLGNFVAFAISIGVVLIRGHWIVDLGRRLLNWIVDWGRG